MNVRLIVCDIDNTEYIKIGTDIFDFLCFAEKYNNSKFYFHNLKFDSEFVIYWLLNNGFTWIKEKKDRKKHEAFLEAQIFQAVEKSLDKVINKALDEIFKDFNKKR